MSVASLTRALSPWAPNEATRWLAPLAVGTATCAAAWFMSTTEDVMTQQVIWTNASVIGFVIAAYGSVAWLLRSRWLLRQLRRELVADVVVRERTNPTGTGGVVAGSGMARFHRADCAFARDRGWPTVRPADAAAAGQRPCGVCRP